MSKVIFISTPYGPRNWIQKLFLEDRKMKSEVYQSISMATTLTDEDYNKVIERLQDKDTVKILHAVMGMVTEAGELMDAVKRHLIYGKPIDFINLMEENGDSFWYQALLAKVIGHDFESTWEKNIKKLSARFPDKFCEKDALNRNLNNERDILENK